MYPQGSKLSGGAVGGITIGILIALAMLILILYLLYKRSTKRHKNKTSSRSDPGLLSGPRTETPKQNSKLIDSRDSTLVHNFQAYTDAALSPYDARRQLEPHPGTLYDPSPSTPTRKTAAGQIGNEIGNISPPYTSTRTPKSPHLSLYPQMHLNPSPTPMQGSSSKRLSTNSTLNWPYAPNNPTSEILPVARFNVLETAGQQYGPGHFASDNLAAKPPTRTRPSTKKLRPRNEFAVGRRPQGMNVFDFIMADNAEQRRLDRARQMEADAEAEFNETGTVVRRKSKC
jgi:hypothetical protein